MGWISNWLYANDEPTAIWRGAQSVPRTLRSAAAARACASCRRRWPSSRRCGRRRSHGAITGTHALPPSADIQLEVRPGDWTEAGLRLSNAAGEEVIVGVDARLRSKCSSIGGGPRATAFHADVSGTPRRAGPWRDGTITLRVLFDRSVIEVFANDGETVITDRVFPTQPLDRLELLHAPGERPAMARMWEMRSIWQR